MIKKTIVYLQDKKTVEYHVPVLPRVTLTVLLFKMSAVSGVSALNWRGIHTHNSYASSDMSLVTMRQLQVCKKPDYMVIGRSCSQSGERK